ncbi:unnamed protein product [Withania somnifera]
MYLQLGEVPTIIVSSPHMARNSENSRPCLCVKVTNHVGKDLLHMRKIYIMELLNAKMVKSFSPIRQDELSSLILSIKSSFGKACKDQNETMISLIHGVLSLGGGFELDDLFPSKKFLSGFSGMGPKLIEARNKVDAVMDKVIDVHRENRANGKKCNAEYGTNEDLIDVFFRVMETGELPFTLTNDNIKAVILDMFVAGSDTSSSTRCMGVVEIMKNPNVMAKAQAEVREVFKGKKIFDDDDLEKLNYLKLVIKETLILHPPTPLLIPGECGEEREIDGYIIPVKSKILVNVWAIRRDPENSRIVRSTLVEITSNFFHFGLGRRTCPGRLFGLALVTLPLAHLLYNFNWTLPNGMDPKDLDMTEANGMTARRDKDLYLVPTPYI